jgi:hypothetical protein
MLSERYHGLAYQPLRLAKNMVAADEWTIDSDAARAVAETKSASAALLRRLIKPVFRDRFGLVGENRRGGDWRYVREDGLLTVRLDFGGRTDQLRYSVTATDPASGYRVPLATVEGLLGLTGGWDWIEESSAQESVNLLAEFVETLAALPRQLALEGS